MHNLIRYQGRSQGARIKVDLPICEIVRTKKLNCLTNIQQQKAFMLELIELSLFFFISIKAASPVELAVIVVLELPLNNSKIIRIKFRRSVNQTYE